jgi:hypothetical protein
VTKNPQTAAHMPAFEGFLLRNCRDVTVIHGGLGGTRSPQGDNTGCA